MLKTGKELVERREALGIGRARLAAEMGVHELELYGMEREDELADTQSLKATSALSNIENHPGFRLRQKRLSVGIKQNAVASILGLGSGTLSRMETGALAVTPEMCRAYETALERLQRPYGERLMAMVPFLGEKLKGLDWFRPINRERVMEALEALYLVRDLGETNELMMRGQLEARAGEIIKWASIDYLERIYGRDCIEEMTDRRRGNFTSSSLDGFKDPIPVGGLERLKQVLEMPFAQFIQEIKVMKPRQAPQDPALAIKIAGHWLTVFWWDRSERGQG